ncbi:MAG: FkbM family methyltransferase [Bacteroidia bacterium]|nr:FkbM family methyltransferase [Bacteroidia bacterium]
MISAQSLFNKFLSTQSRQQEKIWLLLRQHKLKNSDPVIQWNYHESVLAINLSHDLPFNLKQFPLYSQNLGKVAGIIQRKYPKAGIIDVGANIGDSVAVIRHFSEAPVLCIEGNPKFIPLLQKNAAQWKNIHMEFCFVGEKETKVQPMNNLGTAWLKEDESGIPVRTISSVIKNHSAFAQAKLLKIDTDGFDNQIIRGAKEFLREAKPGIFFEYDPFFLAKQNERGPEILDFLEQLGYQTLHIFDNLGHYLIKLSINERAHFEHLHNYFNRDGSMYMDIWAVHQQDADIDTSSL